MPIQTSNFLKTRTMFDHYFAIGSFENIINEGHDLLAQAVRQNDVEKVQFIYLILAKAYYYLGEFEKAYEHALLYKHLVDEQGTLKEDFYVHYIKAHMYEYKKDVKEAVKALHHCIMIATNQQAYAQLCRAQIYYSKVLMQNGQLEEALKEAQIAEELALVHCSTNLQLEFRSKLMIACAHDKLTHDARLLHTLFTHPVAEQNQWERCRLFYTLATNSLDQQDPQTALTYFNQADTIAKQINAYLMQYQIVQQYIAIYEGLYLYKEAFQAMKRFAELKEIFHQAGVSNRLTELGIKHKVKMMERRVNIDPLSGVYNRYYLEEMANSWLEDATLCDEHICCIVFDVDNFKKINDTYGHLMGDEVIKMLGQTCQDVLPSSETIIARYGGDEFVIMSKSYGEADVIAKSESLFDVISARSIHYQGQTIQVSISMGIVCNRIVPTSRFTELFHAADQALYRAKNEGKNQIVYVTK